MHICYVHLSDGHWTVSWPTKGVHPRMARQNRHLGERRDPRTVTKTLELASFWKEQIRCSRTLRVRTFPWGRSWSAKPVARPRAASFCLRYATRRSLIRTRSPYSSG